MYGRPDKYTPCTSAVLPAGPALAMSTFMKKPFLCCALLLGTHASVAGPLALHNPAQAPADSIQFASQLFAANNALPLKDLLNDRWHQPDLSHANSTALLSARSSMAVSMDSWQLQLFYRADAYAKASNDAMMLIYLEKQHAKPAAGKTYDLDYDLKGFTAQGVSLGHSLQLGSAEKGWRLGAAASLLKGMRLKEDEVTGHASQTGPNSYTLQASRLQHDSRLDASHGFNSFITGDKTTGQGYSLDIAAEYEWSPQWLASLVVNDAIGRIHWKAMPTSAWQADNVNALYDGNGNRTASINKTDSKSRYTQRLAPKSEASLYYRQPAYQLAASVANTHGMLLPELSASLRLTDTWRLHTRYEQRFGSVGLGLQHDYGELAIQTDGKSPQTSRVFGLKASLTIPF